MPNGRRCTVILVMGAPPCLCSNTTERSRSWASRHGASERRKPGGARPRVQKSQAARRVHTLERAVLMVPPTAGSADRGSGLRAFRPYPDPALPPIDRQDSPNADASSVCAGPSFMNSASATPLRISLPAVAVHTTLTSWSIAAAAAACWNGAPSSSGLRGSVLTRTMNRRLGLAPQLRARIGLLAPADSHPHS
jgi:hypothetical protein